MEGSSNGSFIPKRSPSNLPRRAAAKQIYVFTIFSYLLFFATLASAAGIFFYERYIDKQLEAEVIALDEEIEQFNQADMNRVKEFDLRLQKANNRLSNSATLSPIFASLERAAANTVRINSLEVTREGDDRYELVAALIADSFDSSLFQRKSYEQDGTLQTVEVIELNLIESEESNEGKLIELSAALSVPLANVPYEAVTQSVALPTPNEDSDLSEEEDELIEENGDADVVEDDLEEADNQTTL